ncbi:MAG: phytanoyl-CoA dioxygenase [Gemmatimonadetes bacterium]|nr:phytanoyl-CoA dioxygenase [Gemmatimonadota bacterium]
MTTKKRWRRSMSSASNLLSDEQLQQFVMNGFVVLNVAMPDGFHQEIYDRCEEIYEVEGNPGNNILPRIPDLQQLFDHPTVTGAFDSILGTDHVMHVHRHGHLTKGKSEDRGWHKDSYWGYHKIRYHHPRWAMAFYYPQAIHPNNGPTRVAPGSHLYDERFDTLNDIGQPVLGEAGTIAIVHFDVWHQATANQTDDNRYMMKFQFHRMSEPESGDEGGGWPGNGSPHDIVWSEHWDWLKGRESGPMGEVDAAALSSESEPDRMNAGYGLGRNGEASVGVLVDTLLGDNEHARRAATYGLGVAGRPAVEGLTDALGQEDEDVRSHAAFALGDMGSRGEGTVARLVESLTDGSERVRHHVAEALGTIASDAEVAVPALTRALEDEDAQVRYNAAYSLACFGTDAADAVPALVKALNDDNRYASGHAVTALRKIRTPEAVDALLAWMETTRWCSFTTKDSTF